VKVAQSSAESGMSVLARRLINLVRRSALVWPVSSIASSAFGCACSSSPPRESLSTIHGLPVLLMRTVLKAQLLFLATATRESGMR
jgi:hypothetical protein